MGICFTNTQLGPLGCNEFLFFFSCSYYYEKFYTKKKWNVLGLFRAIRTRTVDFLGKTDKTYFYRNDSNCFKDPTCIFLHWALSSTDVKIS